jgi:hypothetical protein
MARTVTPQVARNAPPGDHLKSTLPLPCVSAPKLNSFLMAAAASAATPVHTPAPIPPAYVVVSVALAGCCDVGMLLFSLQSVLRQTCQLDDIHTRRLLLDMQPLR